MPHRSGHRTILVANRNHHSRATIPIYYHDSRLVIGRPLRSAIHLFVESMPPFIQVQYFNGRGSDYLPEGYTAVRRCGDRNSFHRRPRTARIFDTESDEVVVQNYRLRVPSYEPAARHQYINNYYTPCPSPTPSAAPAVPAVPATPAVPAAPPANPLTDPDEDVVTRTPAVEAEIRELRDSYLASQGLQQPAPRRCDICEVSITVCQCGDRLRSAMGTDRDGARRYFDEPRNVYMVERAPHVRFV